MSVFGSIIRPTLGLNSNVVSDATLGFVRALAVAAALIAAFSAAIDALGFGQFD